jgi:hypothetical protein
VVEQKQWGGRKVRRIAHFSCGAASAVATKLSKPDEIWYASTGSEDEDNARFARDCEEWFGQKIKIIKSEKYNSTWEVWESRKYISGVAGAPCTSELKVMPRLQHQRADDVHIFGYTADSNDIRRAKAIKENWPELQVEVPLIERGITKAACLALIQQAGIQPPRTYALGFPNANCIPCCKAQSPSYWALVRKHYPAEFDRMAKLSRKLNVTLARMGGKRIYIDEIPENHPVTEPIAPACDFLCGLAEQELET